MEHNTLSLFNGMNCIGLALDKLGVKSNIYASEIDKYANKVSDTLFPNTTNLGDVRLVRIALTYDKVKYSRFCTLLKRLAKLDDHRHNNIQWLGCIKDIKFDLIVAGSPCQGFSFAGKQLNFRDKRSRLFFEFVKILEKCRENNPNIKFLLENVRMKKQYEDVISRIMDVMPLKINSSLLSAQNRYRLYWTNIGDRFQEAMFQPSSSTIKQPKDKGILLKDILETEVDDKYFINLESNSVKNNMDIVEKSTKNTKSTCIDASYYKGFGIVFNDCRRVVKVDKKLKVKSNQDKASCFTAGGNSGGNHSDMDLIIELTGAKNQQNRVYSQEGKSCCLNTRCDQNQNILIVPEATNKGFAEIKEGECFDATFPDSKTRRGRKMSEKSNCLTAAKYDFCRFENARIRRLTPKECMRLQTVPEWAIEKMMNCGVSDSQLYKMLGNGWTVDVIAYILSHEYH